MKKIKPIADFDATGWTEQDWHDLHPEPGSFVAAPGEWREFEMRGEKIHAANWLHASYISLRLAVERHGEEFGICARCHHAIRYAVEFSDANENTHLVGEDCAQFIISGLNLEKYAEKRLLSEMKAVETKNGPRTILSMKTPEWFWGIPKNKRPAFVSLKKYDKPGKYGQTIWYLTIWGETGHEVIQNWDALKQLRDELKRQ